MIPEESNNTENNPPTVMHIHIAGSENIIIGSRVSGETVSIGNQALQNNKKKNRTKFLISISLPLSLVVGLSIFYKLQPNEDIQAFPIPVTEKNSREEKGQRTQNHNTAPSSEIKSTQPPKSATPSGYAALTIDSDIGGQKEKNALHKDMVEGVKEILSATGLRYTMNPEGNTSLPALTCRVSLRQSPVRFGASDGLIEHRISLSIAATDRSGATCYAKTFYSKPQVSDPASTNDQSLKFCLDDLRRQIDGAALLNCLSKK